LDQRARKAGFLTAVTEDKGEKPNPEDSGEKPDPEKGDQPSQEEPEPAVYEDEPDADDDDLGVFVVDLEKGVGESEKKIKLIYNESKGGFIEILLL
jgi:hypothetical protein